VVDHVIIGLMMDVILSSSSSHSRQGLLCCPTGTSSDSISPHISRLVNETRTQ